MEKEPPRLSLSVVSGVRIGLSTENLQQKNAQNVVTLKYRFVSTLSPAQDWTSHQHLLQRGEAALAAGQRGRGASGGAERARHVRHGGLLDHLGRRHAEQLPFCLANLI